MEKEFDHQLKKAITAEKRKEQKAYLQSLEASLADTKQPAKKFNWRIAASILVLIGLGSYFFVFHQSPSSDELYSNYFSPYENVIVPIVRDQVKLTKKAQVFAYYERGNYSKAIDGLNALTETDSIDATTINFYKANAYLQLKEFEQAKSLLLQVVDQNNEWKEESLWYLALLSLKLNDNDTAISYLKRLQKQRTPAYKSNEIQRLLEVLD